MSVRLRFYGQLAERFGHQLEVFVPQEGCSISDLRLLLLDRFNDFGPDVFKGVKAAVADELVPDNHHVSAGAEVEFFSVLSGG